ncbi:MAG: uracil-DNA glycosylase family protein [Chloroflexota bacterium]
MQTPYDKLAAGIRACTVCSFRDAEFTPLAPAQVTLPVAVMFIGENPSWELGQGVPFDEATISGRSLETNFLQPLGLKRSEVWVTNLFKCRYPRDVTHNKQRQEHRVQGEVVAACKRWLGEEIRLARPKVVVSLSDRQVFRRLRTAYALATPARFARAVGRPHPVEFGSIPVILFPMVHPDVARPPGEGDARKPGPREKWASVHCQEHLPALARLLEGL